MLKENKNGEGTLLYEKSSNTQISGQIISVLLSGLNSFFFFFAKQLEYET